LSKKSLGRATFSVFGGFFFIGNNAYNFYCPVISFIKAFAAVIAQFFRIKVAVKALFAIIAYLSFVKLAYFIGHDISSFLHAYV
jgi:hypothetical protein